ncbi:hypothetical protein PDESU_03918 [Pontiella desulfatans]|uniref:Alginate lyase domain-containing protein n=1 Tax=Pontiella desulfatans TaxID=2750659 RepID=A0A6C2U5Z3_PONDE|nr:hypothetical protein [Pontiella desulfatans]VGO15335.1 hypothetical protein PDESU_03918 [Pontiella desulfatans]
MMPLKQAVAVGCALMFFSVARGGVSCLEEWSGVSVKRGVARLAVPGEASFTYPDGERGWHRVGLSFVHDGSANWRDMHGIRFEVFLPADKALKAQATMQNAPYKLNKGSTDVVDTLSASFGLAGKGWHTVTLPLESFNLPRAKPFALESIKSFSIKAGFADGSEGELKLRNLQVVKADRINLESGIRSRSAKGGETVVYELLVSNCTDEPQAVVLSQSAKGREVMGTTVEPSEWVLQPGERKTCTVSVTVSGRVASGGHETQTIIASANGHPAGKIEYLTAARLPHPYLIHTQARWDAVREKAKTVEWAKKEAAKIIKASNGWNVPEVNSTKISKASNSIYLIQKGAVKEAWNAAIAWQLTGDKAHAEKVALFLRRLSDPETGYPKTLQASSGSLVQEGVFFQHAAWAYDTIHNAAVLTGEDHANIEQTFRLYFKVIDQSISQGITGNWEVAQLCGAVYCALAIQDLAAVERFIEGPGGFYDQVSNGIMADGWWYECAIGYNGWVTSEFTQLALALQPWGIDYLHASFPAAYSKEYSIFPVDAAARRQYIYGKPFQKWGPIHKPYVKIQDMWNAMLPYIDYDGVMFANNDAVENRFDANYYEIAYFAYGDPKYASVIKGSGHRDLVYGVAELPEQTPAFGNGSAFSDNVGAAMLRSTQEEPRERIQAVLKYGTHGGYHGHFDRTALNSLMRYGRSFYNPEHVWYSYPNFMYAYFVQSSLPHNMVVVDMKQQEAVESHKLLFSTNELMQVTAVETLARWSSPPYGGINYPWFTGDTFQEKCWDEGRHMPVPENEPKWGVLGSFTDRVTQRRLMAVTDDYVVLADYLEAPEEHTFDCLFNIKGFQGIEGARPVRHTEQMNPDPVLAAQLITDCNWYSADGTTKVSFETQYGKGADNAGTRIHGADGVLKMDVYSAWPREREVMIGTLPEAHGVNRKFWYAVKGDGKTLADGKFGAWILGRDEIDVSLEGIKTLTLTTKAEFKPDAPKTLFWANPVIVTADGKELNLSDFKLAFSQIDDQPESGSDYYGGPIKIAGRLFEASVPANPLQSGEEGTVTLDLTGLNAVRFTAHVGGDYPLGDETWRRKSLSFRTDGKQARYLTVIEPFEKDGVIASVEAASANEVDVKLKDGRTQKISIQNLEKGKEISVTIREFKNGTFIREEGHGK